MAVTPIAWPVTWRRPDGTGRCGSPRAPGGRTFPAISRLASRIAEVSSQSAVPYEPTTVPLTGVGPSVQRSLMVDVNSPNAGSSISGL